MTVPFVVVSDFDGTITAQDLVVALTCHVNPDNRTLVDRINRRDLDLRSGLTALFESLPSENRQDYEAFIQETLTFRPGFHRFQEVLEEARIPFYIVSNGLDFMLDAALGPQETQAAHRIVNHARFDGPSIAIDWRYPCEPPCPGGCGLCKHAVVAELRARYQAPIVFVGDGVTDFNGAKNADWVFARSHLQSHLDDAHIEYTPYESFDDVLNALFVAEREGFHD